MMAFFLMYLVMSLVQSHFICRNYLQKLLEDFLCSGFPGEDLCFHQAPTAFPTPAYFKIKVCLWVSKHWISNPKSGSAGLRSGKLRRHPVSPCFILSQYLRRESTLWENNPSQISPKCFCHSYLHLALSSISQTHVAQYPRLLPTSLQAGDLRAIASYRTRLWVKPSFSLFLVSACPLWTPAWVSLKIVFQFFFSSLHEVAI